MACLNIEYGGETEHRGSRRRAEPPQNLPIAAAIVQTVLPLEWNGLRVWIAFHN